MADLLKIGDKIEMNRVVRKDVSNAEELTVYVSQILDFSEDEIVAAMPISEGHIVPLEVGMRMETYFYTAGGIYKCVCKVTSRGKEGNLHICSLAMMDELSKFQRREFYRLECTMAAECAVLDISEIMLYVKEHTMPETTINPKHKVTVLDISGGGVRLVSDRRYDKADYLCLRFEVDMNIGKRNIEILGKVIQSNESAKRDNLYDTRIQFKEITNEVRDVIIKYIFEQQRIIQKRERG